VSRVPEDAVALSNGSDFQQRLPENIATLKGNVSNTQAVVIQLRDQTGLIVAAASQMLMPRPPGNSPLGSGRPYEVAYSIIYPGKGTLYSWCVESSDSALTKFLAQRRSDGAAWSGEFASQMTSGPRADGKCNIDHGTGEFAGARGTFRKVHVFTRFDPTQKPALGIVAETRYILEIDRQKSGHSTTK
jgi:hypothetical protein